MSLQVIYGKSNCGKTTYIFNKIKEQLQTNLINQTKTYVIVPEQFALSTEENLSTYLGVNGLFNIEVLTFKRMAYKVFNELNMKFTNISDVGKKIILYNLLNNSELNIFTTTNKGNIDNILDIFSEFDRYNVLENNIENVKYANKNLEYKMKDLVYLYKKYKEKTDENEVDSNTNLDVLYENILNSDILKHSKIYIDEFYGFTNQEIKVITKLIENNDVMISFCINNLQPVINKLDIYNTNKQSYFDFVNSINSNNISIDNIIEIKNDKHDNNKLIDHLKENLFNYPYNKYEKDCNDNIKIFACINPYTEIQNLAQQICDNINNGYKYKDIVVITRDIPKYEDLIWGIFKKYNIPYFLDNKKSIINNQISVLIFSILDILISNFSYESIFSYLKTGFLPIDIDDIFLLENYVIKWGIKGNKWFDDFKYEYDEKNEEVVAFLEKINILRKKIIDPLLELKQKLSKKNETKYIVNTIYEFLSKNDIEKIINEKIQFFTENNLIELEKEYINIWNYYLEVFEQISLSVGNEKIDIAEFKNILEISLTDTQEGFAPLNIDNVVIGDIDRSRVNQVKLVYFLGVQNGQFPITYTDEGLLNDIDREFLLSNNIKLAKTTKQRTLEDQFNIYKIISMATEKVYFSYILNDLDGISYRPSFIINKICKIFNINENIIDNESIKSDKLYNENIGFDNIFEIPELVNWYKENNTELYNKAIDIINYSDKMNIQISEENIKRLYGDDLYASVSKLEEYTKCPYSFYLKYGLNIKQRDTYTIRSLDIGNFNHNVLDEYFRYLIENNIDFDKITKEQTNEIAQKIIDKTFENLNSSVIKNARNINLLKAKLKRVLLKSIWVLTIQIKNSSFRPVGTEVEFSKNGQYHEIVLDMGNNKKIHLKGKIDRIDIADTNDGRYIRIIDYKSSNKTLEPSDIYNGLNLQLITYLDAITDKSNNENQDLIPGGMLYFKVDDPIIELKKDLDNEEIENLLIEKLKLNGLILNDKTLIRHMDNTIDKKSNLVNINLDKEGLSKNKNAITYDNFIKLQKYSKKILIDIGKEILKGKINIKPYYKSKTANGCTYCNFNSICKFNSKNENCKYNVIRKFSNDEIFDII